MRASAGGRVSRFYERCQALGCKALGVCASLTTGRARDRQSRWATAMTQARRVAQGRRAEKRLSARRNGRLGGCRKDACCQAYILFWKRWPFSSLVCHIYMREKKDSIYCDAGPGARRRDREWPIGEKRSTHGLGPWSALFFDPGIWRACVWVAEAFSVHLRNSRFERSSRQLSGTHRSPLTRPRPLHFLSPLPLLPLLAARVCLPSSSPAPATSRARLPLEVLHILFLFPTSTP